MEESDLAFILMDPFTIDPTYEITLGEDVIDTLAIESQDDVLVLAVVVVPEDIKKTSVNLKAPIILNVKLRKGAQYIIDSDKYKVRHYVMEEIEKLKSVKNPDMAANSGGNLPAEPHDDKQADKHEDTQADTQEELTAMTPVGKGKVGMQEMQVRQARHAEKAGEARHAEQAGQASIELSDELFIELSEQTVQVASKIGGRCETGVIGETDGGGDGGSVSHAETGGTGGPGGIEGPRGTGRTRGQSGQEPGQLK
jgi:hypothetical protein